MFASDSIRLTRGQRSSRRAQPRGDSQHRHAVHRLGLSIVGGEFPVGAILPNEADLLLRYGVSRTILREALKTLSAKGMVLARARVGTRVLERRHWNYFDPDILFWHAETGVDRHFLGNLAEMRLAFEPEAAALAAERRTPEQMEEMYACIRAMDDARSAGGDFVQADLRFHVAIAEASANPMMRSLSAVIEVALEVTFVVSSPIPDTKAHALSVARHAAIADAIASGDADAARDAMRAVIRHGIERMEAVGSALSTPA